jgi:hypothetical protein
MYFVFGHAIFPHNLPKFVVENCSQIINFLHLFRAKIFFYKFWGQKKTAPST